MRSAAIAPILLASSIASAQSPDFGFDFVAVGDPGNEAYTERPDSIFTFADGRGRVDQSFRITRTEVTNEQFVEFLLAYAPVANTTIVSAGFVGSHVALFPTGDGGFIVEYMNGNTPGMPANVPYFQAFRYANWLHNNKEQSFEAFNSGAYEIGTATLLPDGRLPMERSEDARFWVPDLDELLKAGYYDPDKNGEGPGWWRYPNSSDEAPISGRPEDGGTTNNGVDDLALWEAGSYPDQQSPWELLDVSGGMRELTEDSFRVNTAHRSGAAASSDDIESMIRETSFIGTSVGFRLATHLCPADVNRDGAVETADFTAWLDAFIAQDPVADQNNDGIVSPIDFGAWLFNFNRGC